MNFAQPRKQSEQVDRIELKKNGLRSGKRDLAPDAAVDIDMYICMYIYDWHRGFYDVLEA